MQRLLFVGLLGSVRASTAPLWRGIHRSRHADSLAQAAANTITLDTKDLRALVQEEVKHAMEEVSTVGHGFVDRSKIAGTAGLTRAGPGTMRVPDHFKFDKNEIEYEGAATRSNAF